MMIVAVIVAGHAPVWPRGMQRSRVRPAERRHFSERGKPFSEH
jgi:hypothetical protein